MKYLYTLFFLFISLSILGQDLYPVKVNGLWGYINSKGKLKIKCQYTQAFDFTESLAIVEKNGKFGAINQKGKVIIPFQFDNINPFKGEVAEATLADSALILDKKGNILIASSDKYYYSIYSEYNIIQKSRSIDSIFLYDIYGNLLYKDTTEVYISEGLIAKKQKNKYGFIDSNGKVIIDFIYEDAKKFTEGLAAVKKDSKYGFINKKGEEVIPFSHSYANPFEGGYASVYIPNLESEQEENNLIGIIDKKGDFVIAPVFDIISEYNIELNIVLAVKVQTDFPSLDEQQLYGIYDLNGKLLYSDKYSFLYFIDKKNGIIEALTDSDEFIILDRYRNITKNAIKFDDITSITSNANRKIIPIFIGGNKFSIYKKDSDTKMGYINQKGEIVWQPTN